MIGSQTIVPESVRSNGEKILYDDENSELLFPDTDQTNGSDEMITLYLGIACIILIALLIVISVNKRKKPGNSEDEDEEE